MVHGRSARDCEATIDAIRDETGVDEYCLLWSMKEYKKVRLDYFTPEWDDVVRQARRSHVDASALERRRRRRVSHHVAERRAAATAPRREPRQRARGRARGDASRIASSFE